MPNFFDLNAKLLSLPRRGKQLVMIAFDSAIIIAVFCAVSVLETQSFTEVTARISSPYFFIYLFLTIAIFVRLGFYRAVLRFVNEKAMRFVVSGVIISSVLQATVNIVGNFGLSPIALVTNCFGLFIFIGYLRIYLRKILQRTVMSESAKVIIFGPMERASELLGFMEFSQEYEVVAIVSSDASSIALTMSGIPVVHTNKLVDLIATTKAKIIFTLTKEMSEKDLVFIRKTVATKPVEIRSIPDIKAILTGRTPISELPSATVDDLLGRPKIKADKKLLSKRITGLNVLVTGGGGSIGSELCKKIVKENPSRLIIVDLSELALYEVTQSMDALIGKYGLSVEVIGLLGSVCDGEFLHETLNKYNVDTIYHAAAYKHVPIIENNIIEGFKTNVLGTNNLIDAAIKHNVGSFTLVSSDKAVRPKNVMGATKRIAELLCQSKLSNTSNTNISIVRFGNVMGSSGSVIPLFNKQIDQGLPVTVTHPAMTRYFMTIDEAAQLVLQASAMAKKGAVNVYLLEMGEPVNILNLAKQMIRLSGKSPVIVDNPSMINSKVEINNVPILLTGLRPGEKLFEELHVGGATSPTIHPRIFSADSDNGSVPNVGAFIDRCEKKCRTRDTKGIITELLNAPIEYAPEKGGAT